MHEGCRDVPDTCLAVSEVLLVRSVGMDPGGDVPSHRTRTDHWPSTLRYTARRVRRHLSWARTHGLGTLVEEDGLDLVERMRVARAKSAWRRVHGVARGSAVPLYVVGVQRSGTNMVVKGLELAPEFEVHNENDKRVFHRFQLRSDEILVDTVNGSEHRYVLFKPLCDSHRADQLLALQGVPPGKAIWVYRDVDERARSAIAKFGDANLRALRHIVEGCGEPIWQGRRLSTDTMNTLARFDYETMTPATAAALFWYARNSLYFELSLDRRDDVFLSSYDAFVAAPQQVTQRICAFLELPWRPSLCAHVQRRHPERPRLPIDPAARDLCDALGARLDWAARAGGATSIAASAGGV